MGNAITGWRVSDEISMSDHNHIVFEIKGRSTVSRLYRNPRKTDWGTYVEELGAKLKSFPGKYSNQMELDHCGEVLKNIIVSAFENNCRLRTKPVQKGAPWWNPTLETLKKNTRRLYKGSKKTNNPADREAFRDAQRKYKKEIERAKSNG